jgi:hypothetical protein
LPLQLLKRRAGGKNKFSMFDDSDSDEEAPPAKRTRTQAQTASALPSQVPNTGTSTSEPMEVDRGIVSILEPARNYQMVHQILMVDNFRQQARCNQETA